MEGGDWRAILGKDCCWLQETARGDRREEIPSRECLWRKTQQPRKRGATAESHTGDGLTIVAFLSSHAGTGRYIIEKDQPGWPFECQPPEARKDSSRAIFPGSWPPASLCTACHQRPHDPSSPATSTSCPYWGRPTSSRAASSADSCGRPPHRGGNKTTVKLQGQSN